MGRRTAGAFVSKSRLPFLPILLILFYAGCDGFEPAEFEQEYVVESYQVALEPLQPVRLSRTAPIGEAYNFAVLAVRDARVRVNLLRADGTVEVSYPYAEQQGEPGVYRAEEAGVLVQPLRTYALDVTFPDRDERVTAMTVVPDTFELVQANADTVVYQSTEQLELTVTRSEYPGRQNIFIFTTEALDVREELLTPFAKNLFEDNDDIELEDLRVSGSGIINEGNFEPNPDGSITIAYPWLAIVFYGPNRLTAFAIDDNVYDFIRSQSVQQGGSTLPPGEIPNVLESVDGGTGVFGSYARSTFEVFVRPAGF